MLDLFCFKFVKLDWKEGEGELVWGWLNPLFEAGNHFYGRASYFQHQISPRRYKARMETHAAYG